MAPQPPAAAVVSGAPWELRPPCDGGTAVARCVGGECAGESADEDVQGLVDHSAACPSALPDAAESSGGSAADNDDDDDDGDDDDDQRGPLHTDADAENSEVGRVPRCVQRSGGSSPGRRRRRPPLANLVSQEEEEEEEGMSLMVDQDGPILEVSASALRSRLWARSLLRLKRSIDEVYCLCEFESDEALCRQVRVILETGSKDIESLMRRLEVQEAYTLFAGEYPFKGGLAWTTPTPRAPKAGESALEELEKAYVRGSSPGGENSANKKMLMRPRSKEYVDAVAQPCPVAPVPVQSWAEMAPAHPPPGLDALPLPAGLEQVHADGGQREETLQMMVQSALHRVHGRLGQAPHRRSPEELLKRSEDRQRQAQQRRATQGDQRMSQVRQVKTRMLAARERRQERDERRQRELLEKMSRARQQYQEQLRMICEKARRENQKTAEVAYIAKEALEGEKEILKKKQENATVSRSRRCEEMRKKLKLSATRVAKVSENRRKQVESWQCKVQQEMEEKDRLAAERRQEHIDSIRLKSQGQEGRSDIARGKRRELQEEEERTSQEYSRFCKKHLGLLALNCDGLSEAVREEVVMKSSTAGKRPGAPAISPVGTGPTPSAPWKKEKDGVASVPRSDKAGASGAATPLTVDVPTDEEARCGAVGAGGGGAATGRRGGVVASAPASLGGSNSPSQRQVRTAGVGSAEGSSAAPASPASPAAEVASASAPCNEGIAAASTGTASVEVPQPVPRHPEAAEASSAGANHAPPKQCPQSSRSASQMDIPTAPAAVSSSVPATPSFALTLRAQLLASAVSHEEAVRAAAAEPSGKVGSGPAVGTAQRAKLTRLSAELAKALSIPPPAQAQPKAPVEEEPADQVQQPIHLERAEAVLPELCRLLEQSQQEAEFTLACQLVPAKAAIGACLWIKDFIAEMLGPDELVLPPSARQASNVMLSLLKWVGLLSKQRPSLEILRSTNCALHLADLALAYLDAHIGTNGEVAPFPDAESAMVLFLPQVLHVLSLLVESGHPAGGAANVRQQLVAYLLVSGLPGRLRELLRCVEVRGMRASFEGTSPVPLLLIRSVTFLSNLMSTHRSSRRSPGGAPQRQAFEAQLLQELRRTEIFGVVSALVSILLSAGAREKPASTQQVVRLPQIVVTFAVQAVRILNCAACLDLTTVQEVLGQYSRPELYHLLVCLFDYCHGRLQVKLGQDTQIGDDAELLHESISLVGYYCLQRDDNQGIMCYGEGQSLLAKITSLPLHYFIKEHGRCVLFPTILAACFRSARNLELLKQEMNLSLLQDFLKLCISKREEVQPREEELGFHGRFPDVLWNEALLFFSDDG